MNERWMAKTATGWAVGEGDVQLAEFKERDHAIQFKLAPAMKSVLSMVWSSIDRVNHPAAVSVHSVLLGLEQK